MSTTAGSSGHIFASSENVTFSWQGRAELNLFTSFIKNVSPSFTTFRSFPRILRQFWSTCLFSFAKLLNPSGRMALSCPMISQSNCEKAGQDEQSYNNVYVSLDLEIVASIKRVLNMKIEHYIECIQRRKTRFCN